MTADIVIYETNQYVWKKEGVIKLWDEEEQEEQQAGEPEGAQQDERHDA